MILSDGEEILISEIKKGSSEILKVSLSGFRGQVYLDFRVWYIPDGSSDSGELRPTKKGVKIHSEVIPEILKAIQDAGQYMRRGYSEKPAGNGQQSDFPE